MQKMQKVQKKSGRARRILIAGGGPGGLTAALMLAKAGQEVQLFEQREDPGEGAGIQLSPNCSRVLYHLGLAGQLAEFASEPLAAEFRDWRSGRLICSARLGSFARSRYGAGYHHIHRADLLHILSAAAARTPGISLKMGAALQELRQTRAGVAVRLDSGSEAEGDLLIGADGIHSRVRACLFGEEKPEFRGQAAFRALLPGALLPSLKQPLTRVWWGPGQHLVHYPVRSGELVNFVGVVPESDWQTESWTQPGELEELRLAFAGWHRDIQQLLAAMEEARVYKWALFDRPPMKNWSLGAATLLGDACHPSLPFLAEGAAMAIEDAAVLATCLGSRDPLAGQLKKYEGLRRRRTAEIQQGARRNAFWFHVRPPLAWLRNLGAGLVQKRLMKRIYALDPLKVA